jgi:hypothetical protein
MHRDGLEWLGGAGKCPFAPANGMAGVITNTGTIE